MIIFTNDELDLIARLNIVGGWEAEESEQLKRKIKPFLLNKTSDCCCYCRRSMRAWHSITIDIEHVLPKGRGNFPQFTFEIKNLSVSCKRCNMQIKKSDTSFYTGLFDDANPFKSEYYKFVHPNLDEIDRHLSIRIEQVNTKQLIKYCVINASAKGQSSYDYFKLEKIEINTFDEAQGLDNAEPSDVLTEEVMFITENC